MITFRVVVVKLKETFTNTTMVTGKAKFSKMDSSRQVSNCSRIYKEFFY